MEKLTVNRVQQSSLGEHVVRELRVLIIGGGLAPGTHLVEGALAEQFDVSRGPIRDALRQLEAEGLVESRRRGLAVKGLSAEDIDELYELRGGLESLALSRAIRRAPQSDTDAEAYWAPAQQRADALRAAAKAGDADRFAASDLEFHSAFYALAGHRRLTAVWAQYRPTFEVMLTIRNATDKDLTRSARSHADLLSAAREGDEDRAQAVLRRHLDDARLSLRADRAVVRP
jgi:GntR family transcriptional regulator of gluconate operon